MDEQNKHRSGRKFDNEDIIDVEDNLSTQDNHSNHEDLELEDDVHEDAPAPVVPKRRTGLVTGVVLASLAVVGGGYYYLEYVKPQQASSMVASQSSSAASSTSSAVPSVGSSTGSSASTSTVASTAPVSPASDSSSSVSSDVPTAPSSDVTSTVASVDSSADTTADANTSSSQSTDTTENTAVADTPATDTSVAAEDSASSNSSTTASGSETASTEATTSDSSSTEPASDAESVSTADTSAATSDTAPASTESTQSSAETAAVTTGEAAETATSQLAPAENPQLENALIRTSSELNQLQTQLQTQAAEIEQLKGQLQEALRLNRQVANQIGSSSSLQQLSQPLVLAEVIRLYNSASYEIQIAGNVEKAKRIMNLAYNSVLNMKDPAFNPLVNGIAADINVLNNSKGINIDLLFQATSQLQVLLDQVRFISPDLSPSMGASTDTAQTAGADTANTGSTTDTATESSWFDRAYDSTTQWAGQAYDALSSDLGGLIKVEKLSNPDLGIIPVDQVQVIRNNLKQEIRIAQDAILKQEDGVWKTSLQSVAQNVQKYYDPNDERTQSMLNLLNQLQDYSVKPDLPELKFTKDAIEQTSRVIETPTPVQY